VIVVVALVGVVLGGLLIAVARLQRSVRELDASVQEMQRAVDASNGELDRVDTLLQRADTISTRVDSASRLAYATFAMPVIKAMALGAGTKGAARRLRKRGEV
jgi:hypothetical protein